MQNGSIAFEIRFLWEPLDKVIFLKASFRTLNALLEALLNLIFLYCLKQSKKQKKNARPERTSEMPYQLSHPFLVFTISLGYKLKMYIKPLLEHKLAE